VPATVLIASLEHLSALKERHDFEDALTFSDADALPALEAITRQRPGLVALERIFASTPRGAALINRIRADPSLKGCEIRIVTSEGALSRVPPKRPAEAASPVSPVALAEPLPATDQPTPIPAAILDPDGTRGLARFPIAEGIQPMIDGYPATLIDLSTGGAQIIATTTLRPGQRVRIALPTPTRALRLGAIVAWAQLEMTSGRMLYRAGLQFVSHSPEAIESFIATHKR